MKTLTSLGRTKRPYQYPDPFYVVALDPGGTTGIAICYLSFDKLCEIKSQERQVEMRDLRLSWHELGPEDHHNELYSFLVACIVQAMEDMFIPAQIHLVPESFNFRQHVPGEESSGRAKVVLVSCEYIGIVKMVAQRHGLTFETYNSSEGKRYVPDEKLIQMGWLQTPVTPKRHMNDASRQLTKYLVAGLGIRHPLTTTWRD